MKRYDLEWHRDGGCSMDEWEEGDYVRHEDVADLERRLSEAVELLRDVYTSGVSLDDERIRYMEVQIYRSDWQDIGAFLAEEDK